MSGLLDRKGLIRIPLMPVGHTFGVGLHFLTHIRHTSLASADEVLIHNCGQRCREV